MKVCFRLGSFSLVWLLVLVAVGAAQEFQKTYRIGAGGEIRIGNISGDVIVGGYDGDAIIVTATKEGRDKDLVEIEDRSSGNRVDIGVRYPERSNISASVRFELKVPRGTNFVFERLSSVSGDVQVEGVTGSLRASSVSGAVRVKNVSGSVSASSVSGDLEVEINRLEGGGDMKFSSVSGRVDVSLPQDLDADIEMSSLSGTLKTDFPIEVKETKYGPGVRARGRVGTGSRIVKVSTVSGSLALRYSGRG
jgi:hypothetical protein